MGALHGRLDAFASEPRPSGIECATDHVQCLRRHVRTQILGARLNGHVDVECTQRVLGQRVNDLLGGRPCRQRRTGLVTDGMSTPPAAVLVGGFAGTWLLGDDAWQTPFSRDALAVVGVQPGCGLLGVLPHGACGLTETARIVRYLAGESAGQCGTCVAGLPRLADSCESLAAGTFRKRGVRKMSALADTVLGSGACGHPDAVVRLIRSTLDVFEDDVVRHLAGHACRAADHAPVFAVPEPVLAIGRDDPREWT